MATVIAPTCDKCGKEMNLVRMEPSLKGDELLTFHCGHCRQYQDVTVPVTKR